MNKKVFECLASVTAMVLSGSCFADPLTLQDFAETVTGRTFDFSVNGFVYGVERYWPNQRAEWLLDDGTCLFGRYYEWQGKICFIYDEYGADSERLPQCWTFERTDMGITATFFEPNSTHPPISMTPSDTPLACTGPDVGA